MAPFDREIEIEEQLKEAGNMLVTPPSSIDNLLKLLDVSDFFFFRFPRSLIFACSMCVFFLNFLLLIFSRVFGGSVNVRIGIFTFLEESLVFFFGILLELPENFHSICWRLCLCRSDGLKLGDCCLSIIPVC